VASPMMAAPAFAALMGLDSTLVLVTLVNRCACTQQSLDASGLALVHRVLQGRPAVRTPGSRHIGASIYQNRNGGCIARATRSNQSGLHFLGRGAS